jgi:diguanylate cyclase (GGDEF)-like protein
VPAGLILVTLIAILDYATGPDLSVSLFYLIPAAACAWWGGLPHGILVALAGAIAWHVIDSLENPLIPPAILVWNGIVRFGTMALISSLVSRLRAGILREQRLARTDPLTAAANGRTFYEVAAAEAERARRTDRPLTLAYLDLDNFKQLNDRLGHAVGDAALRHVVQAIQPNLRTYDVLARLGGDEFALLLPETDGEGAVTLLARLQSQLAQDMARKGWPVMLSIGAITFLCPSSDVDLMIRRVDAMMYAAKRKGKGRIEHTVLAEAPKAEEKVGGGVERRATARVLCDQAARVRMEGTEEAVEAFAVVHDISTTGVCVYLDRSFPVGTVLLVEPMQLGAPTLLARVVHAVAEGGKWRHGCELSTRLGVEEICSWSGGQQEAAPAPSVAGSCAR